MVRKQSGPEIDPFLVLLLGRLRARRVEEADAVVAAPAMHDQGAAAVDEPPVPATVVHRSRHEPELGPRAVRAGAAGHHLGRHAAGGLRDALLDPEPLAVRSLRSRIGGETR